MMSGMSTPDTSTPRRREQQRSADTKQAILKTALKEFAERGFEAASMRAIAEQSGLTHQLITYHFQSKEVLWQAVATLVYEELARAREGLIRQAKPATAIEQLRQEFIAYFQFTLEQPHLHRFMMQRREGTHSEDRQEWLAQHFLRPHFDLARPLIKAAQKAGDLPKGEPVLLYYAMVSLANTLSVMGPDIAATTGVQATDAKTAKGYMKVMDALLFSRANPVE
ncbi:hypothetical protein CDL60_11095 [Roseateles noduli]|nr:hypothetical protein CDL60_11095 [Roseateles noduli]